MKKLIPFFLLILVLAGCGSDSDDPKPESSSKIVGTWTVVSSQSVLSVGDLTYKEYLISFGFTEEEAQMASDMLEQMSTISNFYGEMEFKKNFTWTGDSEFVETPVTGTWQLTADEKTLTLTNDAQAGVTQVSTITRLNDTDLWLEMNVPDDQLPAGMPASFHYKAIIKMTRKK